MLKRILLATAISIAYLTPSLAKDTTCAGKNLIDELRVSDPAQMEEIKQAAAKVPYGNSILWEVSKPGITPSYIFGTIHLSNASLLTLPENVQTAFDQSKTLALEVTEILEPEKLAGQAMKLMKYTTYLDGSSLESKMTPEQIEPIKSRLRNQAGLPWNIAQKMRPWVIMGSLALPPCELARKRAGKPFLDMKLGMDAKKTGKTIIGLETVESQMAKMASLPESTMIEALVDTAKMGDQINDIFATMIALYLKGDTGTLWTVMRHLGPKGLNPDEMVSGYAEFQKIMVDQRNLTMANEAEKILAKGSAFIAIGALHLPGDNGILNILAQRGYAIKHK